MYIKLFFLRNRKQFIHIFSNIEGGDSHEYLKGTLVQI